MGDCFVLVSMENSILYSNFQLNQSKSVTCVDSCKTLRIFIYLFIYYYYCICFHLNKFWDFQFSDSPPVFLHGVIYVKMQVQVQ